MTSKQMLEELHELFEGRALTPAQQQVYIDRLIRFDDRQKQELCDHLVNTMTRFPKVADILNAARELGYMQHNAQYTPHTWTATDCRKCAGSGRMAVFYRQSWTEGPDGAIWKREMVGMMPYDQSAQFNREHQKAQRYVFRCECPAGEAPTLEKSMPRWSEETPLVVERLW